MTMKMRILLTGMAAALWLAACPDPVMDDIHDDTVLDDVVTVELSDTGFWFGDIYDHIDNQGSEAKRAYVCKAINGKWGTSLRSEPGTEDSAADCAFLLAMIDEANEAKGGKTDFGSSAYATGRIVDVNTVLKTLDTLYVPDGRFVAIALGSSEAAWSLDGKTWTKTILPGDRNWQCAAYGNGTFVAFAQRNAKVAWSVNGGGSWRESDLPLDRRWRSVVYGDSKFVAFAENTSRASYSVNGINWTDITLPISAEWRGLAYGQFRPNKRFVVVAQSYGHALWSADGLTWTEADMPDGAWYSLAYGDGTYLASDSGSKTARSVDGGNTWSPAGELPSGMRGCSIVYGGDRFVAVSSGDDKKAAYSTDKGVSWTAVPLPDSGWNSIAYGNGVFVAIGLGSGNIMYSEDADSWTVENEALPEQTGILSPWQSIVFGQ
jgi:hypothetical protein